VNEAVSSSWGFAIFLRRAFSVNSSPLVVATVILSQFGHGNRDQGNGRLGEPVEPEEASACVVLAF